MCVFITVDTGEIASISNSLKSGKLLLLFAALSLVDGCNPPTNNYSLSTAQNLC